MNNNESNLDHRKVFDPEYYDSKISKSTYNRMPDAFTWIDDQQSCLVDGEKMSKKEEWSLRSEEIKFLYEYYVYGIYRSGEQVSFQSLSEMTRRANFWTNDLITEYESDTKKILKVKIEVNGHKADFNVLINLPARETLSHSNGYPVLIEIGMLSDHIKSYLNSNGYATIEFITSYIASDDEKHEGAFYTLYPYQDTYKERTGVLMAWAWGVSKIIDMLQLPEAEELLGIDTNVIMVSGVSRNGKAAAVAGAFDPRIRVTIPASSGAGGMAAFRYVSEGLTFDYSSLKREEFIDFEGEEKGNTSYEHYHSPEGKLQTIGKNQSFQHFGIDSNGGWVVEKYREFTDVSQFPLDQHLLAALCGGENRCLYITTEVVGGDWINAQATYATYLETRRIFEQLGFGDHVIAHIHAIGHAFTHIDAEYLVSFVEKMIYHKKIVDRDLSELSSCVFDEPNNKAEFEKVYDRIRA